MLSARIANFDGGVCVFGWMTSWRPDLTTCLRRMRMWYSQAHNKVQRGIQALRISEVSHALSSWCTVRAQSFMISNSNTYKVHQDNEEEARLHSPFER